MNMNIVDQSFLSRDNGAVHENLEHFVDFSFLVRGYVRMFSVENGKSELFHEDPNVVVHLSRKVLANLLAYGRLTGGDPLSDYVVNKAKFGNRGEENDVFVVNPDPASVTDTDLEGSIFTVSGANFTVEDVVQQTETDAWITTFKAVMDIGEGHGSGYQNYSEMGLFTENDTLFARKTFPSFIKTAARKWVVFWSIIF